MLLHTAILSSLSLLLSSSPAANPRAAMVKDVLELSGTLIQLDQIPAQIAADDEQRRAAQKAPLDPEILAAMKEAFTPALLKESVTAYWNAHADEKHFAVVLETLRSPLVRRMTAAEVASGTPEARAEMQEFMQAATKTPLPPARVALIDRLDKAARVSEGYVGMMVGVARPLLLNDSIQRHGLNSRTFEEIDAKLAKTKARLLPQLTPGAQLALAFSYRSFSDAELAQYVAFYEGPSGAWYSKLNAASLDEAFKSAGKVLAGKVASIKLARTQQTDGGHAPDAAAAAPTAGHTARP